jgi:hypothetical protein
MFYIWLSIVSMTIFSATMINLLIFIEDIDWSFKNIKYNNIKAFLKLELFLVLTIVFMPISFFVIKELNMDDYEGK